MKLATQPQFWAVGRGWGGQRTALKLLNSFMLVEWNEEVCYLFGLDLKWQFELRSLIPIPFC